MLKGDNLGCHIKIVIMTLMLRQRDGGFGFVSCFMVLLFINEQLTLHCLIQHRVVLFIKQLLIA